MDVKIELHKIEKAAGVFSKLTGNNKVFAFHGEMGAGKTTFINAICRALHVQSMVSSPTFSIVNEYAYNEGVIYHIDLYRVKNEREAIEAGVEEALYSGELCFVEWPEKAPGIFPPSTVHCYLSSTAGNARNLQINL